RISGRRRRDRVVEHVHVAAAHRCGDARLRGARRRPRVDRRPRRPGDPSSLAGEDVAAHAGVSREELLGDRRHLHLRARAELFPARLRYGPGVHGGDARPRDWPECDQRAERRAHALPRRACRRWLAARRRFQGHSSRPRRRAIEDPAADREGLSRRLRHGGLCGRRGGGHEAAVMAKRIVSASLTLTTPPTLTGLMPKSVCFTWRMPAAVTDAPSIRAFTGTVTDLVRPCSVTSPVTRRSI